MVLPMSESNTIPTGGFTCPRNCIAVARLAEVQTVKPSGRIAKVLGVHFHPIHHCEEEVRHRRLFAVSDAASRLNKVAAAVSSDERGKIFVIVLIAVRQARAV